MSISSLGIPYQKNRQKNKELFESRLQLNLTKKIDKKQFSTKINKSLEKAINLSGFPKDFSFHKFFKISTKQNLNTYKKRINNISHESVIFNLTKFSNRKIDISNSLHINPKTNNNSLTNNKKTNSTFLINNNLSSIRYNVNKINYKIKEIKRKKKNLDISSITKNIKKDKSKKKKNDDNNNKKDNNKKGQLLTLNLNISSFQNKVNKNKNKSGLKTNINKNNNKNKSRNIFFGNKINSRDNLKKTLKNNILSKEKKDQMTLNYSKDNSVNNLGKYSKKKNLLTNISKYIFKSFNTYHPEILFTQKNDKIINNSTRINDKKNNNNKNSKMQVNNLNINNYINCNISYDNNQINNNRIKNHIKSINDIFISKEKPITNKGNYNKKNNINNNNKNNTKIEKHLHSLNKEKRNNYHHHHHCRNKRNDKSNSSFETEKEEYSKNDDQSNEDSGLLSFDKIEDLIIYHNMKNIKKNDNFLFYKNDRESFNHKYRKLLNKKFIL